MIVELRQSDREKFADYIGGDYGECLYLYLNFANFKTATPNQDAWLVLQNEQVCGVMLRYYGSLHIFSREIELVADEISDFIAGQNPPVVWINSAAFQSLREFFSDYSSHVLPVMESRSSPEIDTSCVAIATADEIPEIAELMYDDELYKSGYDSVAEIEQTFSDRFEKGIGRSYIIRKDGVIAAHIAVTAMADNIAVYGALIVRNEYRKQGLARLVRAKLMQDMASKGVTGYDFVVGDATAKIDIEGGAIYCCDIIKLEKIGVQNV